MTARSLIFLFSSFCFFVRADLFCATWNLKWFPSGRANLRNTPEHEAGEIKAVAKVLRQEFSGLAEKDNVILFLQEIRDEESCLALIQALGIRNVAVSSLSQFKDTAGIPIWQQVGIFSDLPVLEKGFVAWKSVDIDIPRGYAYAVFTLPDGSKLAACCLHLKSNLNFQGDFLGFQLNVLRRELAAEQLHMKIKELSEKYGGVKVIVAGDFNTDEKEYPSESTLETFLKNGFSSCFENIPERERVTCPGRGIYPDVTFDYIFHRGFSPKSGKLFISPGASASDHNLVTFRFLF